MMVIAYSDNNIVLGRTEYIKIPSEFFKPAVCVCILLLLFRIDSD